MKHTKLLLLIALAVLLAAGGWVYKYVTNETYEGMSIIPEDHEDIPLFNGLEPRRNEYVIEGNQWEDIYTFYMKELPGKGWKLRHKGSAMDDNDPANDWGGFMSTWTKDGFEGELSLSAGYFQAENVTEVKFDQHIPPKITSWIDKPPARVCVYAKPSEENCTTIEDKNIDNIVHFIDEIAYDTSQFEQQKQYGIIEFLNDSGETYFSVKVHYSKEGQILFLESEKGEKEMKPEGEFFEWTKLEHLIK
ncbi:hypothetical protein DFO73_106111 [Cytobacillus oceanisediminis]|uniref:Uncharacterized protein n=1 Tax=Cytobacillus oceanisediminis TaxID=665099 RepID=A0A2V2ZW65_9BACI|nr:hypothetical protein [Cytobacillus oceanisediminis]PWW28295.1 hypothetical protein DFO73_106111 [Cytobacillus oceanisediminis]